MDRPCPHRDDQPCTVCLENVALRAEVERLRAEIGALETEIGRLRWPELDLDSTHREV